MNCQPALIRDSFSICDFVNSDWKRNRKKREASMWIRPPEPIFNVLLLTMPNNNFYIILLLLCASVCFVHSENIETNHSDCPDKCVCRKVNDNGSQLKVKCGGLPQVKLTTIKDINFDNIKYDVVQLYVCLRFYYEIELFFLLPFFVWTLRLFWEYSEISFDSRCFVS